MLVLKAYLIGGFVALQILTLYAFGAYIRRRTGQGVVGDLDFMRRIPRGLRWMPVLATVAILFMYAYFLVFIFYPDIQNYYFPIQAFQNTHISILGAVFLVLGTVIFVVSQFQLGLSYRINLPANDVYLVTNGIYAISRNPLYMGLIIALFGIFLMLPNWIYLICWAFYAINYHYKITVLEEPYLRETYGKLYEEYCRKVNRYF